MWFLGITTHGAFLLRRSHICTYIISFKAYESLSCQYLWLDLPICALFAHNLNVHLSPSLDGYNNWLTVHVCTRAKALTVWFYWGFFLQPVWHHQVLRGPRNGTTHQMLVVLTTLGNKLMYYHLKTRRYIS